MSKKVSGGQRGAAIRARTSTSARGARSETEGLYTHAARKYLNAEEIERTLIAIEKLPPGEALFARTLAFTGARITEVLALHPTCFQIARGIVSITTLKRRRHVVREVPIPPELMAALDLHFSMTASQREPKAASERLWPWCRQTGWRLIKRTMEVAGIHGVAASPRGLRHGFGIGTLQAGVPLNLVQRWLGHANMNTTAVYTNALGPEEIAFATRYWVTKRTETARATEIEPS